VKHAVRLILGSLAVVGGAALAGMTLSPQGAAAQVVCYTPTAVGAGDIAPFGIPTDTPTSTPIPVCTPVRVVRTATPTFTATVPVTNTPVPPTEVPATNTPVPPTATSPSGGAGGAGVQPPNTGSGPAGADVNWLALGAAGMLVLAGSGSLAAGARRRR